MFKHLSILIIGFSAGLFVNLAIELSSLPEVTSQRPEVKRMNYLYDFVKQERDTDWAKQIESDITELFEKEPSIKLHQLECFSDICVLRYDNPELKSLGIYKHFDVALSTRNVRNLPFPYQNIDLIVQFNRV